MVMANLENSTTKATLLSLHPFPHNILDRILGDFALTTELMILDHIDALIDQARLKDVKTVIFDYDMTLADLHQSLSLEMAQALINLIIHENKALVILTSAWFADIEKDLQGGYHGHGVNFFQMLPAGTSIVVMSRFYDQAQNRTGAKAHRYTAQEERLPIDGLEDIFDHMWRQQHVTEARARTRFAKDEAIRCYLQAQNLSVNDMVYMGDSFYLSGSDLPVLNIEGIVAIQVKDFTETLEIISR